MVYAEPLLILSFWESGVLVHARKTVFIWLASNNSLGHSVSNELLWLTTSHKYCHNSLVEELGASYMWTVNFQMFKLVLEKAEEQEIKLQTSAGSSKKQEHSRKISISALLTMPKPSTVWITINCGKFWKRWQYQKTWPASWETYMQVRKKQNWTWNNRLVPNRKRSMSRLYIVTLLI